VENYCIYCRRNLIFVVNL